MITRLSILRVIMIVLLQITAVYYLSAMDRGEPPARKQLGGDHPTITRFE